MISGRIIGLAVGLLLGIVWMWLGFIPALIVAATGIVGWLVGAVVSSASQGTLNLGERWSDLLGRRGTA
jgi:hypothetical protein